MDAFQFLAPIRLGDVVILRSRVNAVFRTSMEVEVTIEREDFDSGERVLCAVSLLTFVNIGEDGRPAPIPPLVLETDDDRERSKAAGERRARRLAARS